MITRRVQIQLIVFATLTVIACTLIFFKYARVPAMMGIGQYNVSATFSEGAGLYPQANVTYRGVTVGKVTAVDLASDGVRAKLRIAKDAKVPADVDAVIKSVSAIGEQYVDLVPRSTGGPRLDSSTKIPIEHTRVPRQIAAVLDDVDSLLATVPVDSLAVVLDEAEQAFAGLGPDLARLNTSTQSLVATASENYEETHQLIGDAEPLLDTQVATSEEIRGWTKDLAGFTRELRANDRQVRGILRSVPPAADQVTALMQDLSGPLPRFLESADVIADLLAAYHKPLEQIAVIYPRVVANNIAAMSPQSGGLYRFAFKTIANYPGGCKEGWPRSGEPLGPRPPTEVTDEEYPRGAFCKIRQDDPRVARGSRNLECFEPAAPQGLRAPTVQECRGGGYHADAAPFTYVPIVNPLAGPGTSFLDMLGGSQAAERPAKSASWQDLVMGPVSR